jgi:hypothetical protein
MLLHARLTALMNVDSIRKSLWSNYLVPSLHQFIQFCITQMGIKHWKGKTLLKQLILKILTKTYANFLESDV